MAKRNPLGGNPINPTDPDNAVRQMVRGDRSAERGSERVEEHRASEDQSSRQQGSPQSKPDKTTVTPGGFLRKTVYFGSEEWEAIRAQAYREEQNYSDIVRRAVRRELNL